MVINGNFATGDLSDWTFDGAGGTVGVTPCAPSSLLQTLNRTGVSESPSPAMPCCGGPACRARWRQCSCARVLNAAWASPRFSCNPDACPRRSRSSGALQEGLGLQHEAAMCFLQNWRHALQRWDRQ